MGLNAIGAYGFLAKAHIGHAVDDDVGAAGKAADIQAMGRHTADMPRFGTGPGKSGCPGF